MTAPFFLAAVEGTVEVPPKNKNPAVPKLHAELVALAKIRGNKGRRQKKLAKQTMVGSPSATPGANYVARHQITRVRLAFYTNGDPYSYSSLEQTRLANYPRFARNGCRW